MGLKDSIEDMKELFDLETESGPVPTAIAGLSWLTSESMWTQLTKMKGRKPGQGWHKAAVPWWPYSVPWPRAYRDVKQLRLEVNFL